jgi:hypothetical protein
MQLLPADGKRYTARAVTSLQVNTYSSSGAIEFGVVATVNGLGDKLWFVIVTNVHQIPIIGEEFPVRFAAAAYYRHTNEPGVGSLHPDARFLAVSTGVRLQASG